MYNLKIWYMADLYNSILIGDPPQSDLYYRILIGCLTFSDSGDAYMSRQGIPHGLTYITVF